MRADMGIADRRAATPAPPPDPVQLGLGL